MGRIRITPDSIFAVDKMNRRYIAEPLSSYKDRLPFDIRLASIQALFLNRPFLLGQDDLSMKDFSQFAYTRVNRCGSYLQRLGASFMIL